MSNSPDKFTDEYFNVHIKSKLLGQGGQGVVFRTRDPDLAVKLVTDENGTLLTDEAQIERYSEYLKRLRLLPLPDSIHLAIPAALLKDNVGYVMQLLSDMIPFSDFWFNGKVANMINSADIPTWLEEMQEEEAKRIVYYCQTGGLRRKLSNLGPATWEWTCLWRHFS